MKKKRASLILTGGLVVAVIIVGLTLALLQTTTGTKTNVFSSNKNIAIQLREPEWDGYEFEDAKPGDGTTAKPDYENDKNLGVNQAKSYLPGQIIPKNPKVKNNAAGGEGVETYVAIKVQYYKGDVDNEDQVDYDTFKKTFLKETGITINDTWACIKESTSDDPYNLSAIYLYGINNKGTVTGTKLAVGAETTTLFDHVPLSPNIQADPETNLLPSFNIKVQAYAIQTLGIKEEDIQQTMLDFIKAN
ncbi:MAG: hypothetical protein RR614_04205 [Eubacterium sp.]